MAIALQEAAPSEVVVEGLGGDAIESAYPCFEVAIVGIDVLEMKHPSMTCGPCG